MLKIHKLCILCRVDVGHVTWDERVIMTLIINDSTIYLKKRNEDWGKRAKINCNDDI